jgi:virginiamycin A acetyltransferase
MTPGLLGRFRQAIKSGIDGACLALAAPSAATCLIDRLTGGEAAFVFWSQFFALVPGVPGVFMRRGFYRLTLKECHGNFHVGFGAVFSHRGSIVEDSVYIGPYAIVGTARLRRGCLIGSRAGIVSGSALHGLDVNGHRMPTDESRLRAVDIGEDAWLGEGAIVMADVGRASTVAAGAVVSSAVASGVVVAGNPARFIRHVTSAATSEGLTSVAM